MRAACVRASWPVLARGGVQNLAASWVSPPPVSVRGRKYPRMALRPWIGERRERERYFRLWITVLGCDYGKRNRASLVGQRNPVNLFILQLIILFVPGIIWERIDAQYGRERATSQWDIIRRTFVFGLAAYVVTYLATGLQASNGPTWPSSFLR
jgi:hypothetical protein